MTIFMSYSRSDAHQASEWVEHLEGSGYRVWVDRSGIRGGKQWRRMIVEAIREAKAVVLLLSPNSARSDNVRREIDVACEAGKIIIPVEIRATQIPAELTYQLAGTQIIQVWNNPYDGPTLLRASLKAAGVERGGARIVEANPHRRGSGEPNVDLTDLGCLSFLSRIAFWRH